MRQPWLLWMRDVGSLRTGHHRWVRLVVRLSSHTLNEPYQRWSHQYPNRQVHKSNYAYICSRMILYRHCLLIFEFTIVTLFAVFTMALFPLGYSKGNIMRHCRSDTHQPDGSHLGVCGINFVCPDGSHLGVCGINFVCHHCYPLPAMRHPRE